MKVTFKYYYGITDSEKKRSKENQPANFACLKMI